MLEASDLYLIEHYEYGEAFYGSLSGMNYRVNREPFEYSLRMSEEEKEGARLVVWIWDGPRNFVKTPDEMKTKKEFPFSEEGKEDAVRYINETYLRDMERYDKIAASGLMGGKEQ